MAILRVNPTRMVLTQLKKRLKTAARGHKLMKDKRDELIKRFIEIARENKALRDAIEDRIMEIYAGMTLANALMHKEVLEESLMYPKQDVEVNVGYMNIMSVKAPVFDFKYKSPHSDDIYPYGFAGTSGELDGAIRTLAEIFPLMLELATAEKRTALLAEEVEKTRRRVNALEYVVIPDLQDTIRYIRMKLDENERGNQTRLIKVKDMIIEKTITEKRAAR